MTDTISTPSPTPSTRKPASSYIANPNNPTGTMIPAKEMDRFLDRLPEKVVVALDEAYFEYADWLARERGVDYSHSLDYVRQERSVLVLRTFSKVYGLAGARVGYGMGPAELINYLARLKTAFIVNGVGEAGALAALDDREHYEKSMRNNSAQLASLTRQLRELGFAPVESWANFVYIETGEDASALGRRLQMNGVIVRPLDRKLGRAHGDPRQRRLAGGESQVHRRAQASHPRSHRRLGILFCKGHRSRWPLLMLCSLAPHGSSAIVPHRRVRRRRPALPA